MSGMNYISKSIMAIGNFTLVAMLLIPTVLLVAVGALYEESEK